MPPHRPRLPRRGAPGPGGSLVAPGIRVQFRGGRGLFVPTRVHRLGVRQAGPALVTLRPVSAFLMSNEPGRFVSCLDLGDATEHASLVTAQLTVCPARLQYELRAAVRYPLG